MFLTVQRDIYTRWSSDPVRSPVLPSHEGHLLQGLLVAATWTQMRQLPSSRFSRCHFWQPPGLPAMPNVTALYYHMRHSPCLHVGSQGLFYLPRSQSFQLEGGYQFLSPSCLLNPCRLSTSFLLLICDPLRPLAPLASLPWDVSTEAAF